MAEIGKKKRLQLINRLWMLGHFRNPDYPDLQNVKESDLATLTLTDDAVIQAANSYRKFLNNEWEETLHRHHGRWAAVDDSIGPATVDLILAPRCEYPDYALAEEAGQGCWEPCYNQEGVGYSVDYEGEYGEPMPEWLRQIWGIVTKRVVASYASIGCRLVEVPWNDPVLPENIRTSFVHKRGGWIGLAEYSNGTCSSQVFCKLDLRYRPSQLIDQWCRLLEHEWGHNTRLQHTSGGTMNPTILHGRYTPWRDRPDDPSASTLRRYFDWVDLRGEAPPVDSEWTKIQLKEGTDWERVIVEIINDPLSPFLLTQMPSA